jgi:hypothetical protein
MMSRMTRLVSRLRTKDLLGAVTVICFLGALASNAPTGQLLPLLVFGWACAAVVFVLEERERRSG